MGIIAVAAPVTGSTAARFSHDDCVAALTAIASGQGATDGVVRKQKSAQQAAWDLRQAIAEHLGLDADLLTSKSIAEDDGFTFVVFAKDLPSVQALAEELVLESDEDEDEDEDDESDQDESSPEGESDEDEPAGEPQGGEQPQS